MASEDGRPASKAALLTWGQELLRCFSDSSSGDLCLPVSSLPTPRVLPGETAGPHLCLLSAGPSKDFITNEDISSPTGCHQPLLRLENSDLPTVCTGAQTSCWTETGGPQGRALPLVPGSESGPSPITEASGWTSSFPKAFLDSCLTRDRGAFTRTPLSLCDWPFCLCAALRSWAVHPGPACPGNSAATLPVELCPRTQAPGSFCEEPRFRAPATPVPVSARSHAVFSQGTRGRRATYTPIRARGSHRPVQRCTWDPRPYSGRTQSGS